MSIRALDRIVAYEDVLPATWVRRLREQVLALSDVIDGNTFWYDLGSEPRTYFEQIIRHLHQTILRGRGYLGAEYWMRAQPADGVFFLHFDRDEAVRDRYVCPARSSIFYLSDVGGPTAVLPTTPASRRWPRTAAVVWPTFGRYVLFPGNLMHGVLPGAPSRWPRVAFFVNWWQDRLTQPKPLTPGLRAASPLAGMRERHPVTPRVSLQAPEFIESGTFLPAELWPRFRAKHLLLGAEAT